MFLRASQKWTLPFDRRHERASDDKAVNSICPCAIRQLDRHHGACPRGLVTGQIRGNEKSSPPRGLSPWSDDCRRVVSRGSTGTSPVAAIGRYASATGHQSWSHRDKPGGVVTAKSRTLI